MMDSKMVVAILALLFNSRTGNTVSMVQRIEAKETEKGSLGLLRNSLRAI